MFGCSRLARICRSWRKRWSTASVSIPRLISLIATRMLELRVGALAAVDCAHPSAAEFVDHAIRADLAPTGRQRRRDTLDSRNGTAHEGARALMPLEQPLDIGSQFRITVACAGQERRPVGLSAFESRVE